MMQEPRFAVGLAGWTVCLPAATTLEYVARTPLYPVPLAPGCLAGLMQLRGQPVAVFDAQSLTEPAGLIEDSAVQASVHLPGEQAAAVPEAISHGDVLIIGTLPQAAALLIDTPPWPVPAARLPDQPLPFDGAPVTCPFRAAIVSRCILHPGETGKATGRQDGESNDMQETGDDWYEIDPDRLFTILSSG